MTCPRPPTSPNRGKREGRRRKARVHPNTLWTSDARLLPIRTHEDERRISSAADTSTPRWLDEAFLFALQRANVAQGGHAFWQDPVPSLRCPSRARPTLRGLLRALPCTAKGLDMRAKHPVCRTCLGSWIATCLEDGRHEVKCPNGDCTACLPDSSLRTLASSEQWESLLDRRRDAGILRIRRMIGGAGGEDLAKWAAGKTQACPRCFALVERSEGCNHMSCRCGAQFCWVCGQWPCNKSHSRSDLPTISLPEEVEGKEDAAASRPQPQAQPEASDPAPMTAAVLRKVKSW